MSIIAPVHRTNHGRHFRAKLIDPFIGLGHAWMS
jgi:hypothetical protein